jgi:hypothetical protein
MKNYIHKIIVIAFVGFCSFAKAQTSADDAGRIALTPYIAQNGPIPSGAISVLTNKLNQITSANGMGSVAGNSRFIITANINTLTKDLIASAPPMTALTLDVTLYIGDGYEGRKFASHSITVKGVGTNETKAYLEAIKGISANNPEIKSFVEGSKKQIIDYYVNRCGNIMKEAQALEAQNKFEEAIYLLTSIPDAAQDCYNKGMAAALPIYKKKIDRDCKLKLAEATNIWNANQSWDSANEVGEILTGIDPESACYKDVQALSSKIGKRVQELDKREWNFHFESEIGLKKDLIKAYRDVGVAYGNGQPKTVVYNTNGWW